MDPRASWLPWKTTDGTVPQLCLQASPRTFQATLLTPRFRNACFAFASPRPVRRRAFLLATRGRFYRLPDSVPAMSSLLKIGQIRRLQNKDAVATFRKLSHWWRRLRDDWISLLRFFDSARPTCPVDDKCPWVIIVIHPRARPRRCSWNMAALLSSATVSRVVATSNVRTRRPAVSTSMKATLRYVP